MHVEHSGNTRFQVAMIIGMSLAAVLMVLRLTQFSIIQTSEWRQRAHDRIIRTIEIEPVRGRILASDGTTVLAESAVSVSVAADNCALRGTGKECIIANRLADIFDVPPESIISKVHS
ncbi:hypothetical protein JXA80_08515, partial [bacterium]|nr:hypothetical protein [candidate division CSSED10-310 bacterium]